MGPIWQAQLGESLVMLIGPSWEPNLLPYWAQNLGPIRETRSQSALELGPSHCPNGRLGQDMGFGGFAFALKLPELLNRNLTAVTRAKLGQTSCFPYNGIIKLSPNWACQMGPIHCPKFLLPGMFALTLP